MITDNIIN
jgi:hypothetical protein